MRGPPALQLFEVVLESIAGNGYGPLSDVNEMDDDEFLRFLKVFVANQYIEGIFSCLNALNFGNENQDQLQGQQKEKPLKAEGSPSQYRLALAQRNWEIQFGCRSRGSDRTLLMARQIIRSLYPQKDEFEKCLDQYFLNKAGKGAAQSRHWKRSILINKFDNLMNILEVIESESIAEACLVFTGSQDWLMWFNTLLSRFESQPNQFPIECLPSVLHELCHSIATSDNDLHAEMKTPAGDDNGMFSEDKKSVSLNEILFNEEMNEKICSFLINLSPTFLTKQNDSFKEPQKSDTSVDPILNLSCSGLSTILQGLAYLAPLFLGISKSKFEVKSAAHDNILMKENCSLDEINELYEHHDWLKRNELFDLSHYKSQYGFLFNFYELSDEYLSHKSYLQTEGNQSFFDKLQITILKIIPLITNLLLFQLDPAKICISPELTNEIRNRLMQYPFKDSLQLQIKSTNLRQLGKAIYCHLHYNSPLDSSLYTLSAFCILSDQLSDPEEIFTALQFISVSKFRDKKYLEFLGIAVDASVTRIRSARLSNLIATECQKLGIEHLQLISQYLSDDNSVGNAESILEREQAKLKESNGEFEKSPAVGDQKTKSTVAQSAVSSIKDTSKHETTNFHQKTIYSDHMNSSEMEKGSRQFPSPYLDKVFKKDKVTSATERKHNTNVISKRRKL